MTALRQTRRIVKAPTTRLVPKASGKASGKAGGRGLGTGRRLGSGSIGKHISATKGVSYKPGALERAMQTRPQRPRMKPKAAKSASPWIMTPGQARQLSRASGRGL